MASSCSSPRARGPLAWGCYPMVPWAGRLRDGVLRWRGEEHRLPTDLLPPHAIHGTLLETAWEVVEPGPDAATLAADLGPPWPFGGRAVHRVALTPDGLRAELEVHAGDRPMPAIVGWHPGSARVLRDAAAPPSASRWSSTSTPGGCCAAAPTGCPTATVVRPIPPEPWDDCFVDVAGAPGVHWPGALEVRIDERRPVLGRLHGARRTASASSPRPGRRTASTRGEHARRRAGRAAGGRR